MCYDSLFTKYFTNNNFKIEQDKRNKIIATVSQYLLQHKKNYHLKKRYVTEIFTHKNI